MHMRTLPFWVVIIIVETVFSLFIGLLDIYVPKSNAISQGDDNKIVIKLEERLGFGYICGTIIVLTIGAAICFLGWYPSIISPESIFRFPYVIVFLVLPLATIFVAVFYALLYSLSASVKMYLIEKRFALTHNKNITDIETTF